MTATVPRPATTRVVRRVYGARIRDLDDGQLHIDYVGKTRRQVAVREAEHRGLGRNPEDEQPWSDLAEGPFVELDSDEHLLLPWTEEQHKARERWWIRNEGGLLPHRPRYNWRENEDCPYQIPKWDAADARADRDRARGVVSRWTNPELFPVRPSGAVQSRPAVSRPVPGRLGTVWRWLSATLPFRAFVSWLIVALAVCVAVAWGSRAAGHLVPLEAALVAGAVASVGLHVKYWKPIRRRLRRL